LAAVTRRFHEVPISGHHSDKFWADLETAMVGKDRPSSALRIARGIALTWFRGDALSFFGLFTIPAPFSPDRATAGFVKELHGLCANLILILSGLHASAALRKDDVLKRMLQRPTMGS
jgi:hypothetical protein